MKKIEVEVPDMISELPEEEKKKLMDTAVILSIKKRLNTLKKELKRSEKKINKYEEKYNNCLSDIEKKGIGVSLQEHDDYMDWVFWQSVYDNAKNLIEKYQNLSEDEVNVI